ncbi:MAG: TrmH family RNA methyltransferase [Candidatus Ornithospirochaeta sp.]
MLTIKKINTLKPRVRVRKLGGIFHEAYSGAEYEEDYLQSCFSLLLSQELLSAEDRKEIARFYEKGKLGYEDIYYRTLYILGETPADWDKTTPEGATDWSSRLVLPHYLYLDRLRSPYNVGSVFRSAESFGIGKIYISPGTADPMHQRALRTSRGAVEGVEWEWRDITEIPDDIPLFALELGGTDIRDFRFPERGICIIGSEESGVSPEALARARKSLGIVSIKQYGAKGSINVAAASAILMEHWIEDKRR